MMTYSEEATKRRTFISESRFPAQALSVQYGDVGQVRKDLQRGRISPSDLISLVDEAVSLGILHPYKAAKMIDAANDLSNHRNVR